MKPWMMLVATVAVLMNVGCAQEKQVDPQAGSPQVLTPVATPVEDCLRSACSGGGTPDAPEGSGGDGSFYSGSTANLIVSSGSLQRLFFNSYPNTPTKIQINIDLNRSSDKVIVSYIDGSKVVEAAFDTKAPNGFEDTSVNGWVTINGKRVYKAFLQDKYGAVMILIDKVQLDGDGNIGPTVGGSIWFQNFGDNPGNDFYSEYPACGPIRKYYPYYGYDNPINCYWAEVRERTCWTITYGPYDCRTNIVGGGNGTVVPSSSLEPDNRGPTRKKSYEKLGEFTGILRSEANLPATN